MNCRDFLIVGEDAKLIANDVCDFHYKAALHHIPVGAQTPATCNDLAETQFMVKEGTVEFMIGGATAIVFAGDFVRVPEGVVHACRNVGDSPAALLMRTASPMPVRRATRLLSSFAT